MGPFRPHFIHSTYRPRFYDVLGAGQAFRCEPGRHGLPSPTIWWGIPTINRPQYSETVIREAHGYRSTKGRGGHLRKANFQEGGKGSAEWKTHLASLLSESKLRHDAEHACVFNERCWTFWDKHAYSHCAQKHTDLGLHQGGQRLPYFWGELLMQVSPLIPTEVLVWQDRVWSIIFRARCLTAFKKNKRCKEQSTHRSFITFKQHFIRNTCNSPITLLDIQRFKNILPHGWFLSCIVIMLAMLGPHRLSIQFYEFD